MNDFFSKTTKALKTVKKTTQNVAQQAKKKMVDEPFNKEINYVEKELRMPIKFSSIVYKRRGGLGGKTTGELANQFIKRTSGGTVSFHGQNVSDETWELRLLILRNRTLFYYDLETDPKLTGPSTTTTTTTTTDTSCSLDSVIAPRGYLLLKEEHATIQASYGDHGGGAPSPFCISIKTRGSSNVTAAVGNVVPSIKETTKWKLAFTNFQLMMEWLVILNLITVENSVDSYNHMLLHKANPNHPNFLELQSLKYPPMPIPPPTVDEDGSGNDESESSFGGQQQHNQLWMMGESFEFTTSKDKNNNNNNNGKNGNDVAAESSSPSATADDDDTSKVLLLQEKDNQIQMLNTALSTLKMTIQQKDKKLNELKLMNTKLEDEKQKKEIDVKTQQQQQQHQLFLQKQDQEQDQQLLQLKQQKEAEEEKVAAANERQQQEEEESNKYEHIVAKLREELQQTQQALLAATTKLAATSSSSSSATHQVDEEEHKDVENEQGHHVPTVTPTAEEKEEEDLQDSNEAADDNSKNIDDDEFEDCIM